MTNCTNSPHHFYVAEVVGNQATGKVFTILACTDCGEFKYGCLDVGGAMRLFKQEEKEKEK